MRIASICSIAMAALVGACVSALNAGPLDDGSSLEPKILASDTAHPPRAATIELDRPGYVALLLVAPGHSATLLYPRDSATNNHLTAGAHRITFEIPSALVLDTAATDRNRARRDSLAGRPRTRMATPPIDPTLGAFLLLVTSPQRLDYASMVERTSGVSLPAIENEALNAIAKAIKGTLETEPRDLAGYYFRLRL